MFTILTCDKESTIYQKWEVWQPHGERGFRTRSKAENMILFNGTRTGKYWIVEIGCPVAPERIKYPDTDEKKVSLISP